MRTIRFGFRLRLFSAPAGRARARSGRGGGRRPASSRGADRPGAPRRRRGRVARPSLRAAGAAARRRVPRTRTEATRRAARRAGPRPGAPRRRLSRPRRAARTRARPPPRRSIPSSWSRATFEAPFRRDDRLRRLARRRVGRAAQHSHSSVHARSDLGAHRLAVHHAQHVVGRDPGLCGDLEDGRHFYEISRLTSRATSSGVSTTCSPCGRGVKVCTYPGVRDAALLPAEGAEPRDEVGVGRPHVVALTGRRLGARPTEGRRPMLPDAARIRCVELDHELRVPVSAPELDLTETAPRRRRFVHRGKAGVRVGPPERHRGSRTELRRAGNCRSLRSAPGLETCTFCGAVARVRDGVRP